MKFIHVNGDIADFDGYTFMFKNPVDVTSRATIERLLKHPNFRVYGGTFNGATVEIKIPSGNVCAKCGKSFKRGLFMHEKYCKGKS